ncbi:MAG TPA: acetate/propionate family kinase [Chloroflexota bacterium]
MSSSRLVLVLNAGSSSLKWVVLEAATEAIVHQGQATWDVTEPGRHATEVARALDSLPPLDAVGHRVVHGGARFQRPVLVDQSVRDQIADLTELAPLHNPAAVAGIDAVRAQFPDLPQVATFDTAFHASMPDAAAIYPLPRAWTTRWGLRRFGFHGLSVAYAVGRAHELVGRLPRRLVVCHLGAGCSISAVADGRSVSTSMGFTPLEGVMMARRSGSVDPGLLLYLLSRQGLDVAELDQALNEHSGLLGVSGVSADLREVLDAAAAGHEPAQLARDTFVHSLVAHAGAMIAVLGGIDALVFTGGIGEHSSVIRAGVSAAFGYVGLRLDRRLNEAAATDDRDIAAGDSAVRVLVIGAREDLTIVRQVRQVLGWT